MSLHVAESRVVPGAPDAVFATVIAHPLPDLFRHRHVVMPPIKATSGESGTWGDHVGQTRTIHLADGGSLQERLTELGPPAHFGYEISQIRGPMKPLVSRAEGRWSFVASGEGTSVTWEWTLHTTNEVNDRLLPVIGVFWHGYAKKALAEVERVVSA